MEWKNFVQQHFFKFLILLSSHLSFLALSTCFSVFPVFCFSLFFPFFLSFFFFFFSFGLMDKRNVAVSEAALLARRDRSASVAGPIRLVSSPVLRNDVGIAVMFRLLGVVGERLLVRVVACRIRLLEPIFYCRIILQTKKKEKRKRAANE
jgi:hypothetical protein